MRLPQLSIAKLTEIARADAPTTLSKSCSDKLALKQCTSLLSSTASLLIHPEEVYLHALILPSAQFSETACNRAFRPEGRMKPVVDKTWDGGYAYRPFCVKTTSRAFKHSRHHVGLSGERSYPQSLSRVYTPHLQEALTNGVRQGYRQCDPRGASSLCRRRMWHAVADVVAKVGVPFLEESLFRAKTYAEVKKLGLLERRTRVKDETIALALRGWAENGVDDFVL